MDDARGVASYRSIEPGVLLGVALTSVVTLWLATSPGMSGGLVLCAMTAGIWVGIAVAWLIDVGYAASGRTGSHLWRRLLVAPVIVVTVALLSLSLWPDRLRFAVSRRALDRAADRVERGAHVTGRVGRYTISSSMAEGGTVTLMLAEGAFFTWWELVRSGVAPANSTCSHLAADWYLCAEQFD